MSFVIEGESGMGKSTLVRHFLDELEASTGAGNRPFILHARCHERESLAYKGFDGIVDDLASVLASLAEPLIAQLLPPDTDVLARQFPVLRRVPGVRLPRKTTGSDPHDLRARALTALAALFANLSTVRPLVLHIDDLQWAGRDSLELMRELLRDPPPQRLLFLASVRSENVADDGPLREVIDEVTAARECRQLAIGPLTNTEQRELVACMKGSPALGPFGDEFWSQFGASPLFLVELLRYLDEVGTTESLPSLGLDDVLRRRVERLDAGPRDMLQSMAIADEALPLSIVSRAAALSPHDGERAAAALRVGHLARVTVSGHEPWLVCNHDRLRQVLVRGLSLGRRRAIHQRIAGAMDGWADAAPENLARHWLAAGEIEEATRYLRIGAAQAGDKLAFDHAAELLQAALDLDAAHREVDDHQRGERLAELAHALQLAGRCFESARCYEAAAALADGDAVLELERRAADNLLRSGRVAEGIDKLEGVLESVGAPVARTRRGATITFLWRRAALAMRGLGYTRRAEAELPARELGRLDTMYAASSSLGMVDHVRGAAIQVRHLRTALQLGEERRVIRALAIEIAYLLALGGRRVERGQRLGAELLARARELGDPFLCGVIQLSVGGGLFFAGTPQAAIAALSEGEQALTDLPSAATWERVTIRYFLALAQAATGDYNGVAATTGRSLDTALRTNDLYARAFFACIPRTWVLLRDDKPEEAERSLERALDGWPETPVHIGHYIRAFSRALVALYRGRGDEAHGELERVRPHLRELMLHRMPWIMAEIAALEIRAALQSGEDRRALEWSRRLARSPIDYNRALADCGLATLAHRSGDDERAAVLLASARARFAELGARHLVAACDDRLASLGQATTPTGWLADQHVVNPARLFAMLLPF